MKRTKLTCLITLLLVMTAGSALAGESDIYRQQSDFSKMLHKLGRGVVNVATCWVEWPRNVAVEWEKTDPFSGLVLGTVKGAGWTFARLATGVYDVVTFPVPVPEGYRPMMEPEFIITDVWGAPIPELTEFGANDPNYPTNAPIYPQRFNF